MSRFLIVGPSTAALRTYLASHGHDFSALVDHTQTKHRIGAKPYKHITDFSDETTYLEKAIELHKINPIDGILTVYENSVLPAAKIAKTLGLPSLPVESAEACTDKEIMRSLFAVAPQKISPDYKVVTSLEEVFDFAQNHRYPLILKPANLAKSLLVTKNTSKQELTDNYRKTIEQIDGIYKRYAPHRKPKLLIEEFMEGSIHSVDAFVDHLGTVHVLDCIVDYQTGYDVGYDDNFHYSRILPSALPTEMKNSVKETAVLGCQALKMRSTPAHIEIIVTAAGPRIVEIGARNGGYRERMHRIANGIDVFGATLQVATGDLPKIDKQRDDFCAVLELFPKQSGVFTGISHEHEARELASLVEFRTKVDPGTKVGKSSEGHKMCAMIMLHNTDATQFSSDLKFVTEQVKVETLH